MTDNIVNLLPERDKSFYRHSKRSPLDAVGKIHDTKNLELSVNRFDPKQARKSAAWYLQYQKHRQKPGTTPEGMNWKDIPGSYYSDPTLHKQAFKAMNGVDVEDAKKINPLSKIYATGIAYVDRSADEAYKLASKALPKVFNKKNYAKNITDADADINYLLNPKMVIERDIYNLSKAKSHEHQKKLEKINKLKKLAMLSASTLIANKIGGKKAGGAVLAAGLPAYAITNKMYRNKQSKKRDLMSDNLASKVGDYHAYLHHNSKINFEKVSSGLGTATTLATTIIPVVAMAASGIAKWANNRHQKKQEQIMFDTMNQDIVDEPLKVIRQIKNLLKEHSGKPPESASLEELAYNSIQINEFLRNNQEIISANKSLYGEIDIVVATAIDDTIRQGADRDEMEGLLQAILQSMRSAGGGSEKIRALLNFTKINDLFDNNLKIALYQMNYDLVKMIYESLDRIESEYYNRLSILQQKNSV